MELSLLILVCIHKSYTVYRAACFGVGVSAVTSEGPTKHRTGREIAAGKSQINYRDLVINLYTAYHAMHDEFSQKFYRTKFTRQ